MGRDSAKGSAPAEAEHGDDATTSPNVHRSRRPRTSVEGVEGQVAAGHSQQGQQTEDRAKPLKNHRNQKGLDDGEADCEADDETKEGERRRRKRHKRRQRRRDANEDVESTATSLDASQGGESNSGTAHSQHRGRRSRSINNPTSAHSSRSSRVSLASGRAEDSRRGTSRASSKRSQVPQHRAEVPTTAANKPPDEEAGSAHPLGLVHMFNCRACDALAKNDVALCVAEMGQCSFWPHELAAQALHLHHPRADAPAIPAHPTKPSMVPPRMSRMKRWWTSKMTSRQKAKILAKQQRQESMVQARIRAGLKGEFDPENGDNNDEREVWVYESDEEGNRQFQDDDIREHALAPTRRPKHWVWELLIISHRTCQMIHTLVVFTTFFILILINSFVNIDTKSSEPSQWSISFNEVFETYGPWDNLMLLVGAGGGVLVAPLFAGYLYSSIARIESLPYVFPWDCLQWQVLAIMCLVIPVVHLERNISETLALAWGDWYSVWESLAFWSVSITSRIAILVMIMWTLPGYFYWWTRSDHIGTVKCPMYKWHRNVPMLGLATMKAYRMWCNMSKRSISRPFTGVRCQLTRPWGVPGDRPFVELIDRIEVEVRAAAKAAKQVELVSKKRRRMERRQSMLTASG
mmetsp:Transcript_29258/g.56168  ORF Transcript_29258/g.56168 Transcript_29258/m.56168 type:complete len:634 (-) Transcript_29258:424-2325(-)|eukprot:CAMPEP_0114225564 /NCGR_PEP_ID=MMETSP0058-20121206/740_1 /TAXON_ID=36894 /ORGANISM="Pyramimonas parkeae, CCMP726" /LENGTH=633 /DNA_ID=CAMNT_0001336179 /DNA_START=106 /DNA_END=2007 /DNA_ORIENTATION=-